MVVAESGDEGEDTDLVPVPVPTDASVDGEASAGGEAGAGGDSEADGSTHGFDADVTAAAGGESLESSGAEEGARAGLAGRQGSDGGVA